MRRGRRTHREGREGEKEEGQIKETAQKKKLEANTEDQPSIAFQLALLNTQADPVKDPPVSVTQSWAQESGENKEEGMYVDGGEGLEVSLGLGDNDESSEMLLTESELADFEENTGDEVTNLGSGKATDGDSDVNPPMADKTRRQGARKGLAKPPAGVAGSNKMRLAQGLASPRKRAGGKACRQADSVRKHEDKKMEMKGSSDSTIDHKPS